MISKTAEYALRVAVVLERHFGEGPLSGRAIAKEADVPAAYVGTILHRMGHEGLVSGDRGPGGGYRLSNPGASVTVHEIVRVFDDVDAQRHCVLGHAICEGTEACPVHDMWADVLTAYDRFLNEMTLARLARIKSVSKPVTRTPRNPRAGAPRKGRRKSQRSGPR